VVAVQRGAADALTSAVCVFAWRGRSAIVVAVQRGAADALTSPVCVFAWRGRPAIVVAVQRGAADALTITYASCSAMPVGDLVTVQHGRPTL